MSVFLDHSNFSWYTTLSSSVESVYSPKRNEDKVVEMFEEKLFRQTIDFPTSGNNIFDIVFYQNCHLFAELDIII